jgi:hypothetical protein
MANTTWDIANMERHLPDGETCPDGAVYTVHWTASLEENGETAGAYGSIGLGDPNPASFVPFDQLTKQEVVNWVLGTLGVDQVVNIEESLNNQIQQKLNPTSAAGVPW